ncbi:TadE family protein [Sphingobium chlorophenolicum L-1]|uniref:TadE family protein n=1 Tax=Sphingobium chlorophenolicum L-1 TaxID=690566 RepID=F6EXW8_SPHCR|nr:TadE/TadG family type IV pilus assembly protein [Sphingobium chlorophenolicum]AEG48250.1 TadE family protein [Sphingobium chlorophenolicum L-1]
MAIKKLHRLWPNRSGVAAVEFALSLPILLGLTMYSMEAANMAYTSQKLGDIATLTADSVSRIRLSISNGDLTDALGGMKILGDSIDLRNRGRIIVSSVQPVLDSSGNVTNQKVRWQRCTGALIKDSPYVVNANLGTAGIGATGRKIAAAKDSELIFVEIYYTYKPLVSSSFFGTPQMSAVAAMSVRERSANDINTSGTNSPCGSGTYSA